MCDWEAVMYDFKKKIQQFEARDFCILLLGGAYKCTSCPSNQKNFLEYGRDSKYLIDLILRNLMALQNSSTVAPVMKQHIALIQRGLEEFRMFVDPPKVLFELISRTRAWINRISCLTYLYWIDGSNESLASYMETMLSGLLHETMPCCNLGVVSSYFQCTKMYQPLVGYLDLLLRDLVVPQKESIHEGVIFLLSFIIYPFVNDLEDSEMIWAQSLAAMKKFPSLICSLGSSEMKGGVCEVDFLIKVDVIKEKVRKLYVVAPYSSEFCSPSTNVIGILNSMIGNLKEMVEEDQASFCPFLKHQSVLLQKEIVLLMSAVSDISELPIDEDKEIQDLWAEIASTAYNADYFIKLCHPRGCYVWYGIAGLPSLIQAIVSVKMKVNKLVGVDKWCTKKNFDVSLPRGTTSEIEGVYMGFTEEKRSVIDELTRGKDCLTIVSISGSGGQGKTTFAKQIYNDRNVQHHFHKRGWCYVSKDRPIREILVQIIGDLNKDDDRKISVNEHGVERKVHELAELLRKSLKGRRYFIVMDDIWDVDVWRKLELSFPDDKKGSRILFTSRNHDLASQARLNSIPYPLPLFSEEESWELIKKRVFGSDHCNGKLEGIGKEIAGYCKGLPLAVSLIAAVLGRTQQSLDSWNKVAENLKGHLTQEGCGNVLELSYQYLPDYLKSCFLYFGAFQRGEEVGAKELKLLWLGEGFVIPGGEAKDLATKCLQDLVSQNLVVVTEKSSMGDIKRCNVHDLLYDLCLEKCKEDNFLHWVEESSTDDIHSISRVHTHTHRLRIGLSDPSIKSSLSVTKKALPISSLHSLVWRSNYYVPSESLIRFLRGFKLLTILNLKLPLIVDEFPEVMLSLIYLRYLALCFWGYTKAIPPRISNLWKLETLIVAIDWVEGKKIELPLSMWNMTSLRHIHVEKAWLEMEDFDTKESTNLFGGASNIEVLGSLYLDVNNSRTIEFLRNFLNLRKLRCALSNGTQHIMKFLSMVGSQSPHLDSLRVDCPEHDPKRNPVSWNLPKNENLIKLSLHYNARLPWSVVSEVGKKLPNLRVLKLHTSRPCVDKSWKLEDGDFSKLIYLKLNNLAIEEFDVSSCDDLPFPCLEHLILFSCLRLKEIPSIFGEHCCLKRIVLSHCPQRVVDSAFSILEQQRGFGNKSFQVMVDNT